MVERPMLEVPVPVPVQEVLVSSDQKATCAASRIQDSDRGDLLGLCSVAQPTERAFDDVVHDVSGCVVHAASLLPLGLVSTGHLGVFPEDSCPASCWRLDWKAN